MRESTKKRSPDAEVRKRRHWPSCDSDGSSSDFLVAASTEASVSSTVRYAHPAPKAERNAQRKSRERKRIICLFGEGRKH
ncbi:hypothetical protein R1flu_025194 [Riccia fluitans]|uniref:Uncharacterized protein n=1 Tax=Riccia fluitans TaxID=41844 RepID=A0ABD1XX34_9MARC